MSETGSQSSDGGRTKSELHKTIVKLCQEILASGGSSIKKQKVDDPISAKSKSGGAGAAAHASSSASSSSAASSAAAAAVAVPAPVVSPAASLPLGSAAPQPNTGEKPPFASSAHPFDTDASRPLPQNGKPVPSLNELGLARSSFAFGVASNDFSCSVFDSCIVSSGGKRATTEVELAALGKALLLNTRLRRIVAPFADLSEKDWSLLFGPCIEFNHSLGLTWLDLRGNNTGKALVNNMGSLVGLCPNLQTLLLDGNDLREAGFLSVIK